MHLKTKRWPFEWVDDFSPQHKSNLNFEKFFTPRKTNRQSTKKKWIQDASPTKNGWTLAALPNISFRVLVRLLETLGVSYLAATQRYASALIGGRVASTLSVLDSYQKWDWAFCTKGWVKKDPETTLSKCVRVSSWWFVWFLCFLSNILRSCVFSKTHQFLLKQLL